MTKRVFQLGYTLNLAGTETVFMNWYRNINRQQVQFDFGVKQTYNTAFVKEICDMGGRVIVVPEAGGLLGKFKFRFTLHKKLKEYGPYIAFQTHGYWWAGLDCLIAQLAGIKKRFTISHFADGVQIIPWYKKLMRPLCRLLIYAFSTQRLAVSQEAGVSLYGRHISFQIVHNGIDLQKFAYSPAVRKKKRTELGLEHKFVVGHIGRFSEQKNHRFLIDIFAEIYKKKANAHLLLLGVGELEEEIKAKVNQLGLTQAVSFMGVRTDVQDFYQVFDVFVLPSLYEGLPCVAVEAQGAGLPCFLADTIARETGICNTTFIPLNLSPQTWANIILNKTANFIRTDEKLALSKAGFDVQDVGRFIQDEYLK